MEQLRSPEETLSAPGRLCSLTEVGPALLFMAKTFLLKEVDQVHKDRCGPLDLEY